MGSQVAVGGQARAHGRQRGHRPRGTEQGGDPRLLAPHRQLRSPDLQHALALEPPPYDPARAKKLLAEAGYPSGFDGGDFYPFPPYNTMGEAIQGYLQTVGIRTRMRVMERASYFSAWQEKKLHG
jgi:ABC-type transport system substrate-binding protein